MQGEIKGIIKTGIIIYTIFFLGIVVHESVHLLQIHDDPCLKFEAIQADWEKVYVVTQSICKQKLSYYEMEMQAYQAQFIFISILYSIYIIKKEFDNYDFKKRKY